MQWHVSGGNGRLNAALIQKKVVRAAHGRPSIDTVRDFLPNADSNAENLEVERQEVEDLEEWSPFRVR